MNPDGWTFAYEQIEIKNHSIWAGATGDLSEGHVEHLFFHNKGDGDYIWQWDETSNNSYAFLGDTIDCSNPLNDASCPVFMQMHTSHNNVRLIHCTILNVQDTQKHILHNNVVLTHCMILPVLDMMMHILLNNVP